MIAWKPGPVEPQPNLLELEATVYFAESAMFDCGKKKGHRIKRLALALDPPTFLLLRRYIKQTKHASTTSPADGMNAPVAPNGKS